VQAGRKPAGAESSTASHIPACTGKPAVDGPQQVDLMILRFHSDLSEPHELKHDVTSTPF
jgi:hypothetical protein